MKIHFIGIGGVGMSALAQLHAMSGDTVTGSDRLISKGYKLSLAVKEISNMYNLNRNELYKKYLDNKEDN